MLRTGLILLFHLILFMNANAQTAEEFAADWDKEHISTIAPSDVRHADLKKYILQLQGLGLKASEVGRSTLNREIYQVEFGTGPLKVFLWSQMHGDEPTATSALIDMFAYLQKNRDKELVKKISETLTIRAVPMLNPDGAEMFQRRNYQGIDINRDAVALNTPEARLLKQLRDDWNPSIGFNLHNQGSLTTAGRSPFQATISLLVVWGDAAKTLTPGLERNQRIAGAIVSALQKFIPGRIAQYGDEWTPTAFGDNFSAWGTPVILIETGAMYGKDEMFLTKLNFVAFMTALQALATGSERTADPSPYLKLPPNSSGGLYNFIFRGANIINTANGTAPVVADIAVNTERRRGSYMAPSYIRMIGDLGALRGLEEYDVSGFNVVQRFGRVRTGELAELFFYRKDRIVDWNATDLEKQYPPDAVFSTGKWLKADSAIKKK
jgi:hypothetical protein